MTAPQRRGILVAALLVLAGAVLALTGFWWPWRERAALIISGTIEAHEILVGSKVGGRVAKVHVHEGDRVRPGQVLVELERDELEGRKAEAVATVAQSQAALDQLLAGSRPEEIARARAAAEAAQQAMAGVKTWPRPEEVAQARADVAAAEAELAYAEAQYRRFDDLWRTASQQFPFIGDRSARYLTWRFRGYPARAYSAFGLVDDEDRLHRNGTAPFTISKRANAISTTPMKVMMRLTIT